MKGIACLFLSCAFLSPWPVKGEVRLEVRPAEVREGLFWSGATLRVRGEAPPCDGVVLRVLGEQRKETWVLRERKGPFWLPGEQLSLEGSPEVFLVKAEGPLADLLLPEEALAAGVGERALQASLGLSGERVYLAEELFRQWKASGRLAVDEGGLVRKGNRFEAAFVLPPRLSEGALRVEALACRDGRIVERNAVRVPVRRVGLAALLFESARRHPLLYGGGSVLLALFLGLLVGGLFPRGKAP